MNLCSTNNQNFDYDMSACHKAIKSICEEMLYDNKSPDYYRAQRLVNAATIMMYDKKRRYSEVMNIMLNILCSKRLEEAEAEVRKLMLQKGMDAEKFLVETKLDVNFEKILEEKI